VETGLAGLALLGVLLVNIFRKGRRHLAIYGEIVPLLGTISFLLVGMSVSGLEIVGGVLVGVGFVAGNRANFWVVRSQYTIRSAEAA
jgi:hypothetical protein